MPSMKICPKCQQQAPIAAQTCGGCGHIFRTNFQPGNMPTMAIPAAASAPVRPKSNTAVWVLTIIFVIVVGGAVAMIPITQNINREAKLREETARKRINETGIYKPSDMKYFIADGGPGVDAEGYMKGFKELFIRFSDDPASVKFSEHGEIKWHIEDGKRVFTQVFLVRAKNRMGALTLSGGTAIYSDGKMTFESFKD